MRRTLTLGFMVALISCSDQVPTAAPRADEADRPSLSPQQVDAARWMLSDAQERLVPAVRNRAIADSLGQALEVGTASLRTGDRKRLLAAIASARTAIGSAAIAASPAVAASGPGNAPDDRPIIESLQLFIEMIEAVLLDNSSIRRIP